MADREGNVMSSTNTPTATIFAKAIADHLDVIRNLQDQQPVLESIARAMSSALRFGGKILWCGNGGSAADSQHMAAEIVGRFRRERRGLPSIALTTDTSILTAVANDYGYDAVFSRQLEALGNAGDLLVGISTSGNSENVVRCIGGCASHGSRDSGLHGSWGRSDGNLGQPSLRSGIARYGTDPGGAHPRRPHAVRLD
jgi:D-sedoheptulose 7-phosphate isomerase